jgi:S-adenosylmethionine:tRNA ribosyltransferase-isomerase
MKLSDLRFEYPENLVATSPQRPSRVLWVEKGEAREISLAQLLASIPAGDLLVLNNTRVLKRRVFAEQAGGGPELEILFLGAKSSRQWEVLFPSKKYAVGSVIALPEGLKMTLLQKGRPQLVELNQEVGEDYFSRNAELPLPPYIQKARGERHNQQADESWYQTAWAKHDGSFAAPTASLHFSVEDIQGLRNRGVQVIEVTLHVGLGTFLPVTAEDLDQHEMHSEYFEIAESDWQKILFAKASGQKIWALGTTAVRALESAGRGKTSGFTQILLQPGSEFKVVDRLLTNFHQPESTLLALVAGFAGLALVRRAYELAIQQGFRLFSYGDLSVWLKD